MSVLRGPNGRPRSGRRFSRTRGPFSPRASTTNKTLAEVARIAVPRFADWCAVDVLVEGGFLRRVAVQHIDPSKIALAHELHQKYTPRRDAPMGAYHVAATREPEMVSTITDAMLRPLVADEEHDRIIAALGLHSYISVPFCLREDVFGVMSFVWAESARTYTGEDLEFAQQIAGHLDPSEDRRHPHREAAS